MDSKNSFNTFNSKANLQNALLLEGCAQLTSTQKRILKEGMSPCNSLVHGQRWANIGINYINAESC